MFVSPAVLPLIFFSAISSWEVSFLIVAVSLELILIILLIDWAIVSMVLLFAVASIAKLSKYLLSFLAISSDLFFVDCILLTLFAVSPDSPVVRLLMSSTSPRAARKYFFPSFHISSFGFPGTSSSTLNTCCLSFPLRRDVFAFAIPFPLR